MILELAGLGALDGPVTGVVYTRREFIGTQFIANDEQFQREYTDIVQMFQQAVHVVGRRFRELRRIDRRPGAVQYSIDGEHCG